MFFMMLFFACKTTPTGCDGTLLQTCDDAGTCTTIEDCAENNQICHDMGAESHCMNEGAMDMDTGSMDTGSMDSGMQNLFKKQKQDAEGV